MKKTTINLILTILLLCSGISVLAQGTFSVSVSTENNVSTFTVTRSDASYYTISYNLNEGTATNPTKYNSSCLAFTLNNPTREGYTFLGWTGSNGSTPEMTVTVSPLWTGNKSFTANWEKTTNTYNISYDLNGGEMPSGITNPDSYTNEDSFTLNNPVREGYYFLGWTGSNGETPQITVTIEVGTSGDLSYAAHWTDSWEGEGTAENPYIIIYDEQFVRLAEEVNAGNTEVASAHFKLGADINFGTELEPDTTIVGNSKQRRFYGHFDGDGHTINVYMIRNTTYAAPFGIADGATFTNLNVEGFIYTDHKFAGGIASYVYGDSNPVVITNCNSNIHIISTVTFNSDGDGTHAGFVGQCEAGTISFENCVFTGSIIDTVVPHKTIKCAGFLGWVNNTAIYTNCLQAGTIDVKDKMQTFNRNKNGAHLTYTNAYYVHGFNDNQGVQVLATVPENQIAKRYSINETYYYVPGVEITGLKASYTYLDGAPIVVTPTVEYFNGELIENTDYTVAFQIKVNENYVNVNEVAAIGDYKIIITGKGDYEGSYSTTFKVKIANGNWSELQNLLNEGNDIVLDKNYVAGTEDTALVVTRNMTIDMNGRSIDRNVDDAKAEGYVMYVNKNVSLTIVDNSKDKNNAITGGNNIGNGGGIYNEGTLTLQNINITGNRTIRNSEVYGTGTGIYSTGTLTITNCIIENNNGDGGGAGVHALGNLTITGGSISNNTSNSKGAGIRVGGKTSTITDCTITGNTMKNGGSISNGGGVYFDCLNNKMTLVMTGCTITNNSVNEYGGGIYSAGGKILVKDCTISGNSANISGNDIYLRPNSVFTIEGDYENNYDDNIYLCNTAQLIVPTNSNVAATVAKNISSWDVTAKTGWFAIASPVANQEFANVENLTNKTHNIYRYDAEHTTWQEYRAPENLFNKFHNGRGYLYRRSGGCDIIYSGTLNTSDMSYELQYTEGNSLKSYNLIGNPYPHDIYKGQNISCDNIEEKYCVMNTDGTWELKDDSEPIAIGTAILVQATEKGTIDITNEPKSYSKDRANNDNIWFTVENSDFKDVTCVEFKNGHGFNKVAHRNEDAPMLYINYKGENFASVDMSDDTKSINLNFKATKTGRYTLSYKAKGMFNYLHLIDRYTGADVDLLIDDEYSFVASSNENENRFIINLSYNPGGSDNDIFAYQNGSDIIVNGEGTLQVFDVTGRMVSTMNVSGVETINMQSQGVYIFRLIGNEIKTQKIIIK